MGPMPGRLHHRGGCTYSRLSPSEKGTDNQLLKNRRFQVSELDPLDQVGIDNAPYYLSILCNLRKIVHVGFNVILSRVILMRLAAQAAFGHMGCGEAATAVPMTTCTG